MKNRLITGVLLWSIAACGVVAQPDLLDVRVCNYYKYRPDKQAGREIQLTYRGNKDLSGAKVEIWSKKKGVRLPACKPFGTILFRYCFCPISVLLKRIQL